MKIKVYNQTGQDVGEALLPKDIFSVKINKDLIHQVLISQIANRRKVIANTKGRGEVRGGGKKPWAQKGTGRARHGSIRSPLWKGGGVTFGPTKEVNFKKTIPAQIKKKALFMVLSGKAEDNALIIIDDLSIAKPKTKLMADILKKLPVKNGNSLIALPRMDKNLILAIRNIKKAKSIQAGDLNVLDLLNFKYLIMPKDSIKVIKETFLKQ